MINTKIQWCDDTCNPQMGCDGCELYHPEMKRNHCYAAAVSHVKAGLKGFPKRFGEPELYPGRIEKAARRKDLTGQDRPNKPWLNGLPRMIFLDDMGDTFTESLPIYWLMPEIPLMADSAHIWIFLTKRPHRMRLFFEELIGFVPSNFWLGTTVTSQATMWRAHELIQIPNATRFLNLEPLLGQVDVSPFLHKLDWLIIGGESGPRARPMSLDWVRGISIQAWDTPVFIKQLGSANGEGKGGDMSLWPEDLRVREMPDYSLGVVR